MHEGVPPQELAGNGPNAGIEAADRNRVCRVPLRAGLEIEKFSHGRFPMRKKQRSRSRPSLSMPRGKNGGRERRGGRARLLGAEGGGGIDARGAPRRQV